MHRFFNFNSEQNEIVDVLLVLGIATGVTGGWGVGVLRGSFVLIEGKNCDIYVVVWPCFTIVSCVIEMSCIRVSSIRSVCHTYTVDTAVPVLRC